MSDQPPGAPASREEILAALATRSPENYPLRQSIRVWLKDDKDGAKAAWLKEG